MTDDDLAERLLDLGAQVALVPEHRRVQLELLVARIERFVDGATRTPHGRVRHWGKFPPPAQRQEDP